LSESQMLEDAPDGSRILDQGDELQITVPVAAL
jgi:hypothetical protein